MSEPTPSVNIHEAKTHLSRLIERVERGEEIVISRAGTPVAKVVPLTGPTRRRGRGSLRGQISLAPDWDSAAVNDAIADEFRPTP
ncbi:type II toxin-antitoxin system Phd/YefM family antitoxin [Georgenia faecalis]|uniref:Antitoxin n=1 Tax=Georgenia faecalis TaxID=2483799 RepID=A0ABV9DBZ0_9MICO|nr:type II toxin-antitoxin system prevent-host-death family antitoxin [Georgenia faecalis]